MKGLVKLYSRHGGLVDVNGSPIRAEPVGRPFILSYDSLEEAPEDFQSQLKTGTLEFDRIEYALLSDELPKFLEDNKYNESTELDGADAYVCGPPTLNSNVENFHYYLPIQFYHILINKI